MAYSGNVRQDAPKSTARLMSWDEYEATSWGRIHIFGRGSDPHLVDLLDVEFKLAQEQQH